MVTALVFWEPFPLDRSQGLLLGEMVRDFEAENPDIVFEIVPKGGYVGLHGAMQAQLPDGNLPDLAVAFPSMIAEYAQAGVVASLDPFLYDPEVGLSEEDWVDLFPGFVEAGVLPGFGQQTLAFPFTQNAVGMWVNRSLLQRAGWDHAPTTWSEFEQACLDIVARTGSECYPYVESVSTFTAWLYSRGGKQLDLVNNRAAFNGPEGVESLRLWQRMTDAGLARRPLDPFGDYVAFANGQAAFTFSSTGNAQLYAEAYEAALYNGAEPFRWEQTIIPQANPENPVTSVYGASFFLVRSDIERERAAWRFVRWFTDRDQTARWATSLETMPVRASAISVMTDTLLAYPFLESQVSDVLPYGKPEPAVPEAFEIRDILYTSIISATQNRVDPQLALDRAAMEVNAVLVGGP